MAAEVVWSPLAHRDLDDIWEWIAIENEEPRAADRTIEAIFDRMDGLAVFPLAAPSLDSICRIRSDWRFVEERGYLAFFRVGDGRVYVDRVLSGKSDYLRKLIGIDNCIDYYR
ncbi:MAG: type II toxin-antitoxin system RelE/ParE family toxin [Coriobacteriales bacterium]|nr:type II toxin-antitoxin system RelE/ParE family toxin [Coriobacteriales bacterium]